MKSIVDPKSNLQAFRELIILLTRHRQLTMEMAKREITDRYSGQFFGVFWAIGHPLIMMLVYAFIFGFVFKVKIGSTATMPLNYTIYMLSGLIPWMAFQESMAKASFAIVGNANLVRQFVFPIEVLPVKGVIATLITQVIFLLLLIIYVLISQHMLPLIYFLLPVLVFFQVLAMIGVSYVLSAIGVYFRDIKDLVQVFAVVGVYLIPAFYLPEYVPKPFLPILYLNPFSYLIWCFQDVLYFGWFAHPMAWLVNIVLSLFIFIFGYRFFRKLRIMFGNVL
ncbi:MAG: ABC transporter permease [Anaerolineales bacterium]|nr:ABC transporter permease [Anaerolineales bacterium]